MSEILLSQNRYEYFHDFSWGIFNFKSSNIDDRVDIDGSKKAYLEAYFNSF